MFKKIFATAAAAIVLSGCQAEDIEIRISTSEMEEAIAGKDVDVRFIARFEMFGELDEEKRSQLTAIEAIVEELVEIDDYQVVAGDYQTVVTVEGEVPLVAGLPGSGPDAFAIYVYPNPDTALLPKFTHKVEFGTGSSFASLENQMNGISYSLSLDAVQPVSFRLKADSGAAIPLLAGGGQMEGRYFSIMSSTLAEGERATLIFKSGAYDEIAGGFLVALPK